MEQLTQCLASLLEEPALRVLWEDHLNKHTSGLGNLDPDFTDRQIAALSEDVAAELIQKFPSVLQERIQKPKVQIEEKLVMNADPRVVPQHVTVKCVPEAHETSHLAGRNEDRPFRTKTPTYASILIPPSDSPHQPLEDLSPPKIQQVPALNSSSPLYMPNKPPVSPKICPTVPKLNSTHPINISDDTEQVTLDFAGSSDPAIPYRSQPDRTTRATKESFPTVPRRQERSPFTSPIYSSALEKAGSAKASTAWIRSSDSSERYPLGEASKFEHESQAGSSDSESSESEFGEIPFTPCWNDSEQTLVEINESPQKTENYLHKIIENSGLTEILGKENPRVKAVASNAAAKANEIAAKYELTPKTTLGAIRLALYDFVVLCDDSSSMRKEKRIPALKATLKRVAEIATMLEETGISIRFLNYRQDALLDNLRQDNILQKIENTAFSGITQLGHVLDKKIIQPLIIAKAAKGRFKIPLVVVIITDGEPTHEDPGSLGDMVKLCKQKLIELGVGDGSVVFIISRVGSSTKAMEFIEDLENTPDLEQMIYCSKDRLDEKMAILQAAAGNNAYTRYLIELFIAALDNQAG